MILNGQRINNDINLHAFYQQVCFIVGHLHKYYIIACACLRVWHLWSVMQRSVATAVSHSVTCHVPSVTSAWHGGLSKRWRLAGDNPGSSAYWMSYFHIADTVWIIELETEVHLKVHNHREGPYWAFSWLKAPTSAFTFKTLLRHYAERALTPQ